jgi:hypothetical protein
MGRENPGKRVKGAHRGILQENTITFFMGYGPLLQISGYGYNQINPNPT